MGVGGVAKDLPPECQRRACLFLNTYYVPGGFSDLAWLSPFL